MTSNIRVIAFPGAPNLPIFAAMDEGFFEAEGVNVTFEITPSSIHQAEQVAAGNFDVAMTAFDNVVAYCEGQGAAGPEIDPGYIVTMGATQLELSLVVAPEIVSFDDLSGRTLALDAKDPGFAFVLSEMLARAGLSPAEAEYVPVGATPQRWQSIQAGEHSGTLTIEPFTTLANRAGFRTLQKSTDLFEVYQGGVVAARRVFLEENWEVLSAYMRALLRAVDWVRQPGNRELASALLRKRMPVIPPQAVDVVMNSLLEPNSGLTPDCAVLPDGMRCVLDLRARHSRGEFVLHDVDRYIDLTLYDAMAKDKRR